MTFPATVFGMSLSSGFNGAQVNPYDSEQLIEAAQLADRAGLDVVSVTDHPFHHEHLEAYTAITYALATTSRVSGLVSVSNLGARSLPLWARTVATLSHMSGGRLVAGVGAGALWDELATMGVAPRAPAARVRLIGEGIAVLRALTGGGGPVSFDGEFVHLDGLVPSAVATPPIWTGSMGPASLALTGRVADGWLPPGAQDWHSEYVTASRAVIDTAAREAGRDPSDVGTFYYVTGEIAETAADVSRGQLAVGINWMRGSVAQWVDHLTEGAEKYGADGFLFMPITAEAEPAREARTRWCEQVVPAVRARLGAASPSRAGGLRAIEAGEPAVHC